MIDGVLKVVPGQPVAIAAPGAAPAAGTPATPSKPRSSLPMFTHFFIGRPILSAVISILFVLAGAVAMSVSPIEQ